MPKNSAAVQTRKSSKSKKKLILLLLNILLLLIGGIGSPLILRTYFIHGGNRMWFSAFLQTAGFPFLLIPLIFSFLRRRSDNRSSLISLTPPLLAYCTILGLITGVSDYLYSYGMSFLPVSTSALLISTQLGFTAVFAFFIVKQKFSASSINAVVLLTFGAVVLGVHASGDRPNGESKAKYNIGFLMTLGAAVVYGLMLPLVELMYKYAKKEVTYQLVMEMQFIIGLSATVFCAIGMAINKDFEVIISVVICLNKDSFVCVTIAIGREANLYRLGQAEYYLVVFFSTVIAQFFFLGMVGTIKYSSALLSGVIIAVCIPVTEVLAVFFFHEKFSGEKGVALALSLWGTGSYFYGEYNDHKRRKNANAMEVQLPLSVVSE
ncbi:Purine permease 1 [Platanthera zijinensis]|uniref:Probable purine permease n=1 Tax=Platanthera zijinensis TaxID=2320716 RepID=A0AAP0BZ01_9ASPA